MSLKKQLLTPKSWHNAYAILHDTTLISRQQLGALFSQRNQFEVNSLRENKVIDLSVPNNTIESTTSKTLLKNKSYKKSSPQSDQL